HRDLVAAVEKLPRDRVLGPRRRDARIDDERLAAPAEAEDALEAGAIHPARRSGVPTPAPASGMRRLRVDIAGHDVWLRLVPGHVGSGPAVVDRVEHVKELRRLVAAAQP